MTRSIIPVLSVLALAVLVSLLWARTRGAEALTVGELLRHSSDHVGKVVTIKGTVLGSAGVLGIGVYRLHDPGTTQEVLVGSDSGIPAIGQEATASGLYVQAVTLGHLQFGMIVPRDWCKVISSRHIRINLPADVCDRA